MAAVSIVEENITHHLGFSGVHFEDVPNEHTFCSHTVLGKVPFHIENALDDERFAKNPFVTGDPNIRTYLGSPLIAPNGEALGAICALDTKPRTYDENLKNKLENLAATAVHLLEMRVMMKKAYQLAREDSLTKLLNRAAFEEEISKALVLCAQQNFQLSLVYFDVDGFKSVNDTQGHAAGDQLLKLIADTLRARTLRDEIFGRIGGDEFAAIIINQHSFDPVARVGSIKDDLDKAVLNAGFPIGFSLGLKIFDTLPSSTSEALNAADELLYRAKRSGRNQIVTG